MSSKTILPKFTPSFKAAIDAAARRVFGHLPVVPYRTGNKLLQRKPIGPLAVHYYPANVEQAFRNTLTDFTTELEDRRIDSLYRMRRRGKGPAKKGQGKRASKKK